MGKIISAAGEVSFIMRLVGTDRDGFVITGRMGVWDAKIYLSYKEMLVSFLKPGTLLAILGIPVLLFMGLFRQKEK